MGNPQFARWIEGQSLQLRRRLRLAPMDVLDPFVLAENMGIMVLTPDDVHGLEDHHRRRLAQDSDAWSAGTVVLGGRHLVVLNPLHAPTRKRATLMEELAHVHLKHKPSVLTVVADGLGCRSFKKSQERQAYGVGAAALIPTAVLQNARDTGRDRGALAREYGVSTQLVEFRERITGLRMNGHR